MSFQVYSLSKPSTQLLYFQVEKNGLIYQFVGDQKLPSFIIGIVNGLARNIYDIAVGIFSSIEKGGNYKDLSTDDDGSEVLCVLLHGLNNHPYVMNKQRDAFDQQLDKKITFYQPFIPKKGNCSLEEATEKLYGKILNWAKTFPDQPIVFSGVSNGARLAANIASRLKIEGKVANAIKVNCIAGPFFGTKVIHPNCVPIVRRIWQFILSSPIGGSLTKEIVKELAWESEKSKDVIDKIRIAAKDHGVSFDFYASQADSLVLPFTSSLISNIENSKCYVSDKEGHRSIINASREQIIINVKQFLRI